MCPVCLATAAVIVGSATGSGGLAAIVLGKLCRKKSGDEIPAASQQKEVLNDHQSDRSRSLDNPVTD